VEQALYDAVGALGYNVGVQHWLGSSLVPARSRDGLVFAFDVGGAPTHPCSTRPCAALARRACSTAVLLMRGKCLPAGPGWAPPSCHTRTALHGAHSSLRVFRRHRVAAAMCNASPCCAVRPGAAAMLASYKRSDYWCPPRLQGGALSIRQYAAPGRAVCTVAKQEAVCQHAS
jgi:hypothetical protein